MTDLYERYARVRSLQAQLEIERRELETQLAPAVQEFGKPVVTKWGQFSAVERKNWIYPPEIAKAIDNLKVEKNQIIDKAMLNIKSKVQRLDLSVAEIEVKAKETIAPQISVSLAFRLTKGE